MVSNYLSLTYRRKEILKLLLILHILNAGLKGTCEIVSADGAPQLELFQERKLKTVGISNIHISASTYREELVFERINTTFSLSESNTVLGNALDRFKFTCSAPYLTRWTSNIIPQLPATYIHPNRLTQDPFSQEDEKSSDGKFVSQLILTLPPGSSGHVQCESISSSANGSVPATQVYLYTLDGPFLVEDFSWETFVLDTRKEHVLPCNANYPNVTATLDTFGEFDKSNLVGEYDPRIGFALKGNGYLRASYDCVYEEQRPTYFFYNPDSEEPEGLNLAPTEENLLKFNIGALNDEFPLGIFCSSKNFPVHEIYMINCNSQDECNWLRPCLRVLDTDSFFKGVKNCTLNGIFLKSAVPVEVDDEVSNESGTIKDPYTRGMVLCKNSQSQQIQDVNYFITGLDRQRYWLLKSIEIPLRAIVQIIETDRILYTNRPAVFVCETLNFLLISNIRFAIQFKNGTKLLLQSDFNSAPENVKDKPTDVLVDDVLGFSRRQISLNLTTDMTTVICLAPWNNSTKWINTSREIEVRDVMRPLIANSASPDEISEQTFFIGDTSRSLLCNASGEPKPEIQWTVPQELEHKFEEARIKTRDELTLNFPPMDSTFLGSWTFTCNASNDYGRASHEFIVDVEEANNVLSSSSKAGIAIACFLFIALVIGLVVFIRKYISAKKILRNLTPEEIEEFRKGNPERLRAEGSNAKGNEKVQWLSFDPKHEIEDSDLILVKNSVLGEGQYGRVYRGFFKGEAVAVKTTKSSADVSYVKALLSELKIMSFIGSHSNVTLFRGAVLTRLHERIVYVVLELSPVGSLQQFLRRLFPNFVNLVTAEGTMDGHRMKEVDESKTCTLHLIHWCKQIANAMQYLAERQVIHGDLATRNILLFKNNVVKITDFGLSRQLYGYEKYTKKNKAPLPWAWMAIESLKFQEFSTQSDVWSFGVTVWEIFTLAQSPYGGVGWTTEFMNQLENGMRLTKPPRATENIFNKLLECWHLDPVSRPSFSDLFFFFGEILETHAMEFPCEAGTDLGWNPVVYSQL